MQTAPKPGSYTAERKKAAVLEAGERRALSLLQQIATINRAQKETRKAKDAAKKAERAKKRAVEEARLDELMRKRVKRSMMRVTAEEKRRQKTEQRRHA